MKNCVYKKMKKELHKLKYVKKMMPSYIDCSSVYGDEYFTNDDIINIDKQIESIEQTLYILRRNDIEH